MLPNVTLTMASVGSMSGDYGFQPLLSAKVQIKSRTNKKIFFFRRYVFFLNVRLYFADVYSVMVRCFLVYKMGKNVTFSGKSLVERKKMINFAEQTY